MWLFLLKSDAHARLEMGRKDMIRKIRSIRVYPSCASSKPVVHTRTLEEKGDQREIKQQSTPLPAFPPPARLEAVLPAPPSHLRA